MKVVRDALLLVALMGTAFAQGLNEQRQYIRWTGTGRSLGMGGAFTAMINDDACVFFNPAGTALLDSRLISGNVMVNAERTKFNGLIYLEPPMEEAAMGGGFFFMRAENEQINLRDDVFCYTISQRYDPQLSFGVNIKYDTRKSAGVSDKAWTFDLGMVYQYDPQTIVGLSVLNLNEPAVAGTRLWRSFNVGVAYQLDPVTIVTLDIHDITGRVKRELRLGIERAVTPDLDLRVGMMGKNVAIGIGLIRGAWRIDFGYVYNKDLPIADDINIFTVHARF